MTAENFDNTLRGFQSIQPFRVFTVELIGGKRFEIDHAGAMVVRDGVAIFVAPGGIPIVFDHNSVLSFISAPANAQSNGEEPHDAAN